MDRPTPMNRRTALKRAGALAVALGALEAVGPFSFAPVRVSASIGPSDIQFDIADFLAVPPQSYGTDVQFQMPPVHTVFLTAALERTPTRADQAEMSRALAVLERIYPWGATHLVTFVAYGLPYFGRLPGSLVARHMPRLASDASRYVLEEARPGPTDVSPANPRISKFHYNVNVLIERNDILFTVRSDNPGILSDVLAWFAGSHKLRGRSVPSPAWNGLIRFTSSRHMFVQMGLPKTVARRHRLPFAKFLQPQSPMWMGFADQQVNGAGPALICTFAGTSAARLTTATQGDYFDNGSIQHLSHVILDMLQFFDMDSEEELRPGRHLHRARPVHVPLAEHRQRQQGPVHRRRWPGVAAQREPRAALRRTDRAGHRHHRRGAPDGSPVLPPAHLPRGRRHAAPHPHGRPGIRRDWTSPAAAACRSSSSPSSCRPPSSSGPCAPARPRSTCRTSTASSVEDNGLERFLTATRRQNFLIPPRRHRAFPLTELA